VNIFLDFETYYNSERGEKNYSLSKLSTEEYVRHPSFEVLGVGVAIDDAEPEWISGDGAEAYLKALPWETSTVVCHNSTFDVFILSEHYGIYPEEIACTQSLSRLIEGVNVSHSLKESCLRNELGEKGDDLKTSDGKHLSDFSPEELESFEQYCLQDVTLCRKLYHHYLAELSKNADREAWQHELDCISLTIKLYTDPRCQMEIDPVFIAGTLARIRREKADFIAESPYGREVLSSNPKSQAVLESLGVTVPMKLSARTNKMAPALARNDADFLELLNHDAPEVRKFVQARLSVKSTIEETRLEHLASIAGRGPRVPLLLNYAGAHTLRFAGSGGLNPQNFTKTIKQSLLAPKGKVLIECDSSQIECRVLAFLASAPTEPPSDPLLKAFSEGRDVYKQMAGLIFKKDEGDVTPGERVRGKVTVLGAGYGLGAKGLLRSFKTFGVDSTMDEAEACIDTFREQYSSVCRLWDEATECLLAIYQNTTGHISGDGRYTASFGQRPDACRFETDGFLLPTGLKIKYPEISLDSERDETRFNQYSFKFRKGRTRIYGPKVVENLVQNCARNLLTFWLAKLYREPRIDVVLTVHDSVVCLVDSCDEEEARSRIEAIMRLGPTWSAGLPLDCESTVGTSYGSMA
tara:strand:+ start:3181 stop:5088 length:1908 start_codon:yes stop_codon:yes gene_type:complete